MSQQNPNILKMLELLERGPATTNQIAFELGLEPSKSKKEAWQMKAYIACEIKNETICQLEDGTILLL